jgi:hypothetical protein
VQENDLAVEGFENLKFPAAQHGADVLSCHAAEI